MLWCRCCVDVLLFVVVGDEVCVVGFDIGCICVVFVVIYVWCCVCIVLFVVYDVEIGEM